MALKLRLRHSLGEESLVFDEAQAHEPRVIGRARDAAVTVPSLRVALRHCAIFFHPATGQWLLQDGNTRGGTCVNDIAMPGSRYVYPLQPGDIITLGDEPTPPALVIEHVDHARPVQDPSEPAAKSSAAPLITPPALAEEHWFDQAPTGDEEDAEALAALAAAASRRAAQPQTHSSIAIVLGSLTIAITAAVAAFGLWLLYGYLTTERDPTPPAPVMQAPATRPIDSRVIPTPPATQPEPPNDLSEADLLPEPPPAPQARESVDPAGVQGVIAGLEPEDPLRATPHWHAVAQGRQSGDVGRQLQVYQQFLTFPASTTGALRDVVEQWLETTLDRLWWQRITSLLQAEVALTDEVLALDTALRQPGPQEGEPLRQRLTETRRRLNEVSFQISEVMAYGEAEAPDLNDAAQLDRLRQHRDPDRYAIWRREVLDYALTTGEIPNVLPESSELE